MKREELIIRDETISETKERLKSVIESVYKIDICRKTRRRDYVSARTTYVQIMRDMGLGVEEIGRSIGKHHSTVLHNTKCFHDYYKFDKRFKKFHNIILEKFYAEENTVIELKVEELEKHTLSLNLKLKELDSQKKSLESKIQSLENEKLKNKSIHELINERVKPGTEERIYYKLNRFFNGIHS